MPIRTMSDERGPNPRSRFPDAEAHSPRLHDHKPAVEIGAPRRHKPQDRIWQLRSGLGGVSNEHYAGRGPRIREDQVPEVFIFRQQQPVLAPREIENQAVVCTGREFGNTHHVVTCRPPFADNSEVTAFIGQK
jgi:hypothetical protein